MPKFNVTYERFFPHREDEDICEPDEQGFEAKGLSLREAIELCGGLYAHYEANESPVCSPRWFTCVNYNDGTREQIEQGIYESRSFHIPEYVTPASRRRIARLIGALN